MKKLALLLALGLLAACGGSGSSSTSSNTQPVSNPVANGQTGTLSININSPAAKIGSPDPILASSTWRRIVVTNPLIKNSAGKLVQFTFSDYDIAALPAPTISIPNIPIGSGYTVELIEFTKDTRAFGSYSRARTIYSTVTLSGYSTVYTRIPATAPVGLTPYTVINYDAKTFAMPTSGTQSISLVPKDVKTLTTIDRADTFYGGKIPTNANLFSNLSTQYKMKATFSTLSAAHILLTPFNSSWTLKQSYPLDSSSTSLTPINGSISSLLTGPAAYNANNVRQTDYVSQGVFNLKDTLLLSNELATDFQFTSNPITKNLYTKTGILGSP